ncbi:MAG: FAD-dependent oxidoreductase [Bacteroidota bacterium]|nr:FAD-dependent oxidoreductase [Bacteroidota bacterium]
MRKIIQIKLSPEEYNNKELLKKEIAKTSGIDSRYLSFMITKESLDCRKMPEYNLSIVCSNNNDLPLIKPLPFLDVRNSSEVLVIGAGPCGLAAALRLIQKGLKPIIIERGKPVEERKKDIANICRNKDINEDSNFCFGEGGAGTFSDGKLYTRSTKKGNIEEILSLLVHFGADEKIVYQSHAHIGTDKLALILKNIRKTIEKCGGEYIFDTKVVDFILNGNSVVGVKTSEGEEIYADKTILATGHSARDIYQLFYDNNWDIQAKPFAVGVRVEHPQMLINQIQYHSQKPSLLLPPANYSLTFNTKDRGVFSFCMCPGGIIVPSMDREGIMSVNGMSNSLRSGEKGNAAVVVSVTEEDAEKYSHFGALSLMKLQEDWEKLLYINKQIAPAQRITDFMEKRTSSTLCSCSYMPGVTSVNLREKLPEFISENLALGFENFNRKMRGYITEEALLVGLESRTSSPVRIPRQNDLQHTQLKNLYPCGEGAGYAGGITSSALDGINTANKIAEKLGV